jgi:hypothetical protein
MLFKNPVRTSRRTRPISITKVNCLMFFNEIILVYIKNHKKTISTKCRIALKWLVYIITIRLNRAGANHVCSIFSNKSHLKPSSMNPAQASCAQWQYKLHPPELQHVCKAKLSRYRHADYKRKRCYSSYSLLTSAMYGVSGQHHVSAALYPAGKCPRYPLDEKLGGPQRRSN